MKLPYFGLNVRLLFTDLFRIRIRIRFRIPIRIRIQNVYFGSGSDPDPAKSFGSIRIRIRNTACLNPNFRLDTDRYLFSDVRRTLLSSIEGFEENRRRMFTLKRSWLEELDELGNGVPLSVV
jgi:hypothetical protein